MLVFDSGILDPAKRTAAISAAYTNAGLTPADHTAALTALKNKLDGILPNAPETTSDAVAALLELVSDLYTTGVIGKQAAVADIATADATDLATAQALANATKAKVNALLATLRTAGVIRSA